MPPNVSSWTAVITAARMRMHSMRVALQVTVSGVSGRKLAPALGGGTPRGGLARSLDRPCQGALKSQRMRLPASDQTIALRVCHTPLTENGTAPISLAPVWDGVIPLLRPI